MFALFLTDSMNAFYQNIGTFPTVIYTVLLAICVIYWAGAILGLLDLNLLDGLFESADLNADSSSTGPDVLAGLMFRMGLTGVPAVISLSLIVLCGWLLCYYTVHFLFGFIPPGILRYLAGLPVLFVTVIAAALVTVQLIKPLSGLFANSANEVRKHMLGQTAIVRTARVDNDFGEAVLDDGGAGLIVRVRATGDDRFALGDRVVLFEQMGEGSIYSVLSEEEFLRS